VKSGSTQSGIPETTYLFFGGKGGVGKTTCAVATALRLFDTAVSPDRILLFSTDPAHSLADSLSVKGEPRIFPVTERNGAVLDAWEMDAPAALAIFKARHRDVLAEIANRGTILDEADIDQLLNLSLPGMDEVMALFELSELDATKQYSRIVVDTAPSGHTTRLLELPEVFSRWIAALDRMSEKHRYMVAQIARTRAKADPVDVFLADLENRLKRVHDLLYSPDRASFLLVTVPEAMAVDETVRFRDVLKKDGVPVTHLITNRIERFHGECGYCAARVASQKPYLKQIRREFKDLVRLDVPVMADEVRGVESLRDFATRLWTVPLAASVDDRRLSSSKARRVSEAGKPAVDRRGEVIEAKKVIIVGGKGGVGKTTTAAALALNLAANDPNQRFLVFSTDPAHSLADSFDEPIGEFRSGIAGQANLDGVEVNALAKFEQLQQRYQTWVDDIFSAITGDGNWQVQFDREAMRDLITLAPPGIDEIAALSAISDFLHTGAYTSVILDTAPTGHLLRFLELPSIALDWVRTFLRLLLKYREFVMSSEVAEELIKLSKDIKRVIAILTSPADCEFVAVGIPERMSLNETSDLVAGVRKLHVSLKYVVINNVVPQVAAENCSFCAGRRRSQRRYIDSFRKQFASESTVLIAPQHPGEIQGPGQLREYLDSWSAARAAKGRA
jgi:arsenite-transporting ATPase